jgi:hypothetical protein
MTTAKNVQTIALQLRGAELSIVASRLIQTSAIEGHRPDVTAARFRMTVVDLENQETAPKMMVNNVDQVVMIEETIHGANVAMIGVVHVLTIVDENFDHQDVMI